MTIIPRTGTTAHSGRTTSPARRSTATITQPGTAARVACASTPANTTARPSIEPMDQLRIPIPGIDTPTQGTLALDVPDRPWSFDTALCLAEQGRVWRDNRRNLWEITGENSARLITSRPLLRALAELARSHYVELPTSTKRAVPTDPQRGALRMRRFTLTASGIELHRAWASYRDYSR